jgi:hypothetical protein
MALFPLLKTARVASGENSLSLMLYLYLLTYLLALWRIASSHKVFQKRNLLTNSQVAELWKIREHKLNTIPILTEMRVTAQLLYFSYKKGLGGKFGGLEFLANFILK